eukprot:TRINITY_DN714_c3_g1_i1.p1 TRINITY_DN714_c3_g1~~TRINITY_DN714_c3_g1_i1.p1  ORF type:complete len:418 (+),score=132.73 TRINITY_DN714_c3_g1_i1:65-1318(+)
MDYGWEEEALCCVCVDLFVDPVMLECGHNVCKACAEKVFAFCEPCQRTNERGEDVISCPQCRGRTPLPTGIEGLKTNLTLKNIVDRLKEEKSKKETILCGNCEEGTASYDCEECSFSLCQGCKDTQHSKGGYKNHKLHPLGTLQRVKPKLCKTHNKELDLYNTDTSDLMCIYCLQLSDKKMKLNSIIPLPEAVEGAKKEVSKEMLALQDKLDTLKAVSLSNVEAEKHKALKTEIQRQFGELMDAAKHREQTLLKQVEDMEKKSSERHTEAATTLKNLTEHITSILEKFRHLSEAAHHADLLKAKDMLLNRLNSLSKVPVPVVPTGQTQDLSCTLPIQKLTTCIEGVTIVSGGTSPRSRDAPEKKLLPPSIWKISLPDTGKRRLSTPLATPMKKVCTSVMSRTSSSSSSSGPKLQLRI